MLVYGPSLAAAIAGSRLLRLCGGDFLMVSYSRGLDDCDFFLLRLGILLLLLNDGGRIK